MNNSAADNVIRLEAWYAKPIYWLFCGVASSSELQEDCMHILYIIWGGNFILRGARFDRLLGMKGNEQIAHPKFTYVDQEQWAYLILLPKNYAHSYR